MPIFLLNEKPIFPNPELSEPDGLLAVGGDLSPERLIVAYKSGIFPWYSEPPIAWWSPSLRPIIFPRLFAFSRSLYQTLKKGTFQVTFDQDFQGVIEGCSSTPRKDSIGTWITPEMKKAYIELHSLGYAHSVEVWKEGNLVGGLYGVLIGKSFSGESMFSLVRDASKVALSCLIEFAIKNDLYFIDCQVTNEHLLRMGAIEIPRPVFLKILDEATTKDFIIKRWARDDHSTINTAFFLKDKLIKRRRL
ncbi:leucyl/phenylalanyl-tRNA--protein transferase [Thermodesulfovibrio hydrogeniphilus]